MTLLRRTATGLYALAILLLLLVLLVPFARSLPLFGADLPFSYSVLTVTAVAAVGGALNLGSRPVPSALAALLATGFAACLVVNLGGSHLESGVGFAFYLAAAGATAAAGFMAFAAGIEEKRHGPLPNPEARTFRAQDPPAAPVPGPASAPTPAPPTASASPAPRTGPPPSPSGPAPTRAPPGAKPAKGR
ncbi:MAG: hypothetical protein ABR562_00585 [Thermoplasmatota archaeon]